MICAPFLSPARVKHCLFAAVDIYLDFFPSQLEGSFSIYENTQTNSDMFGRLQCEQRLSLRPCCVFSEYCSKNPVICVTDEEPDGKQRGLFRGFATVTVSNCPSLPLVLSWC